MDPERGGDTGLGFGGMGIPTQKGIQASGKRAGLVGSACDDANGDEFAECDEESEARVARSLQFFPLSNNL